MNIAQTILNQLKALTPKPILWSWGASKFQSVKQNQISGINEEYLGGLLFYVRGMKHKGHVFITLNGLDLYNIYIGHVRKGKMNPKKSIKDVYAEDMSDIIDDLIEKQNNYSF